VIKPDRYEIVRSFPFETDPLHSTSGVTTGAHSTREALELVTFSLDYDLGDRKVYEGLEFKRVFLMRKTDSGTGNQPVIVVFDGDRYELSDIPGLPAIGGLGVLRPVQRYVLTAGLKRAREIADQVLEPWYDRAATVPYPDLWGFLEIRKSGSNQSVALTPPIIEQLHPDDPPEGDWDREFIACDGTHRIVERVWNSPPGVLAAVAIYGPLPEPYYARPFSASGWRLTAGNVVGEPPSPQARYDVRRVDPKQIDYRKVRSGMEGTSVESLYRRYFRDLTTGFGPMGGQGGREG
jgi:hypothetical protein